MLFGDVSKTEVYRDDSTAKQKPNTLINDNPTINDDDKHKQNGR